MNYNLLYDQLQWPKITSEYSIIIIVVVIIIIIIIIIFIYFTFANENKT